MKKLSLALFFIVVFILGSLTGCGNATDTHSPSQGRENRQTSAPIKIVATSFPPYDFAREITKQKAQVSMLLPPGAEIHSYEPTPKDIIAIRNCDLFLYVGGENDVWVDEVLQSMGDDAPPTLKLMDCVDAVTEEITAGMWQGSPQEEAVAPDYDPHIWTSPANAVKIVEKMASVIESVDPKQIKDYKKNALSYLERLKELDQAFQETVNTAQRKTIIVGDRFPFRYLADAYGLTYYAAFPGCGDNAEPGAATMAFLIDKMKAENIPVVFYIEFSNQRIADAIAETTGAKTLLLHSCHNVTKQEMKQGASYLSLMRHNLEALKIALN